jgi:hypothetical protein
MRVPPSARHYTLFHQAVDEKLQTENRLARARLADDEISFPGSQTSFDQRIEFDDAGGHSISVDHDPSFFRTVAVI